ncbi:MAG: acetyl-CoA carboxylase biotin carboxylase subunit [Fimbriimonas sp.]
MKKLLIANRGEIALRICRTARAMGIRTVAVASGVDSSSIHAVTADERVTLSPAGSPEGYLDLAKLVDVATQTGADAIHPGYGFLSERSEFSAACRDAGLIFVGPSPEAMGRLGSKIAAKQLAVASAVPVVPGFFEPGATEAELRAAAEKIGYPVMLKASAGGGGRGMRVVRHADQFDEELKLASQEAFHAFGDGAMMVEKLIEQPRHVEVQILADHHGNVACLFERECSIQRRHQKLIEESPSPGLASVDQGWERMRDAATRLIRAASYVGAGTVEFILDPRSGEFYFLEVNARIQVEHPVTEMITGIDLIEWQIRIARGEELPVNGEANELGQWLTSTPSTDEGGESDSEGRKADQNNSVSLARTIFEEKFEETRPQTSLKASPNSWPHRSGHAIEARIVAEDPAKGFLPSIGKILAWAQPRHPRVRVDTGYGPGTEVSRFYDSLIAKVIAHGETRSAAIDALRDALLDFHILGVRTNIAYLLDVLDHPEFRAGNFDTGFLEREFTAWQPAAPPMELADIIAIGAPAGIPTEPNARQFGAWDQMDSFRVTSHV